jgi:hypothetical protein
MPQPLGDRRLGRRSAGKPAFRPAPVEQEFGGWPARLSDGMKHVLPDPLAGPAHEAIAERLVRPRSRPAQAPVRIFARPFCQRRYSLAAGELGIYRSLPPAFRTLLDR